MIVGEDDKRSKIWGLHPNVFFLGLVSFFTDISSDIIFGPLFPLFLSNILHAPMPLIGFIAGITEGCESGLKIVSGWVSDRLGKRKILALVGYGLSTLAKPFLYFSFIWEQALAVRLVDRIGKGIRTSPRDALLADSAPAMKRGRSFGFHRAMDTAGAVVGLLIAAAAIFLLQRESMELLETTYQRLILIGIIPAVIGILILFFFVREGRKEGASNGVQQNIPTGLTEQRKGFSPQFKTFLIIMVIFTLGNSSDVFLCLRAQNLGIDTLHIVMMFILFNVVYATSSPFAGIVSDHIGRKKVIAMGWLVYALVYLGFALASESWQIWILFAIYGSYHGTVDGVARALIADTVSAEKRGTAYGIYHGTVGFTLLAASLLAGWMWDAIAPSSPFFFGAGMAAIATIALLIFYEK